MGIFFADALVVYRSIFRTTISMNSTQADFISVAEVAKFILYVWPLLNELNINQQHAINFYEDNNSSISMYNYQCPARRAIYVNIHQCVLLDWFKTGQMIRSSISTNNKPYIGATESFGPQLFAKHSTIILEQGNLLTTISSIFHVSSPSWIHMIYY